MTRICSSRARQQRGGSRVQRASREPVRVTPQSRPRRRAPVVSRALGWAPLTLFNLHVTLWDGGRYSVYSQLRHREPERLVQDQISAKATIQGQSSPTAKPLLISPPLLPWIVFSVTEHCFLALIFCCLAWVSRIAQQYFGLILKQILVGIL